MRKQILVGTAAVVLAVSGGAIALAQTDGSTTTTTKAAESSPAAPPDGGRQKQQREPGDKARRDPGEKPQRGPGDKPHRRHGHGPGPGIGHAIHGELIVPVRPADGADTPRTFETVEFDRGKVVSATDERLTLERPDGVTVTLALDDETTYKGVSKGSELQAGQPVFAVSKDGVARHVGQPREGEHPKRSQHRGTKPAPDGQGEPRA